jgi:hypothetical protein
MAVACHMLRIFGDVAIGFGELALRLINNRPLVGEGDGSILKPWPKK